MKSIKVLNRYLSQDLILFSNYSFKKITLFEGMLEFKDTKSVYMKIFPTDLKFEAASIVESSSADNVHNAIQMS